MSEISWKSRTSCPAPYVLDVSSPGIERRFFAPGQLAGYVGREIEVTLVTPARGAQISRLLIGPTETLSP
jgi:ribosome maturation factor RimP